MAFAIDTQRLLDNYVPEVEEQFNYSLHTCVSENRERRLQLGRVCVYAAVIHDGLTDEQCSKALGERDSRERAALDWQAEQGDDEDEMEVFHHLKQLAAITSTSEKWQGISRNLASSAFKAGTTTLLASVQSQAFTSCTQERPPSSFRRYSIRDIHIRKKQYHDHDQKMVWSCWGFQGTHLQTINPRFLNGYIHTSTYPQLVSRSSEGIRPHSAIFFVQLDFLELSSQSTCVPSSPGKRRRTINPFHQVPPRREELDTSRAHHPPPHPKRFRGVRFRSDRRRWVAETKPPKSKNKVSFGEFQSETKAARVVDVAFHHYGKPLNFADTPQILSKLPSSAALNPEEKLKLVKDQAEWIKSRFSSLPSTSTPCASAVAAEPSTTPLETPSTAHTLGLRSFSEISSPWSMGGCDEADDGVSEPQPLVHFMAGLLADSGMEARVSLAGHADVVNEIEGSVPDAIVEASDMGFNRGYGSGTLITAENLSGLEQECGMQSMCMDFDSMSPALLQAWSPGKFLEDGLVLEEHNLAM